MTCSPLAVDAEHHQLNIAPEQDTSPIGLHDWSSHVACSHWADDAEHHQLYIPPGHGARRLCLGLGLVGLFIGLLSTRSRR